MFLKVFSVLFCMSANLFASSETKNDLFLHMREDLPTKASQFDPKKLEETIRQGEGLIDVKLTAISSLKDNENPIFFIMSTWKNQEAVYKFFRSSAHEELVNLFGADLKFTYKQDPQLNKNPNAVVKVVNMLDTETGFFSIEMKSVELPIEENSEIETDKLKSFKDGALLGLGLGLTSSVALLVKDYFAGVVIKGGPEWHGKERILPLSF